MNEHEAWQEDIIKFWFQELDGKDWFARNEALDRQITQRYITLHGHVEQVAGDDFLRRRQLLGSGHQALAGIIVLDQFPRNMFRDTPKAFASDDTALAISQAAIEARLDQGLTVSERQFLYMPHMHAEDPQVQARSVALFSSLDNEVLLGFAVSHKQIIDRFGRFPHRNNILQRPSTAEELAFLNEPGSSF